MSRAISSNLLSIQVRSDYLTQLFRKIFTKTNDNPFYNAYCGNGNCDLHTRCPIRNNFEFLTNEKIQDLLVQKIIETSILVFENDYV